MILTSQEIEVFFVKFACGPCEKGYDWPKENVGIVNFLLQKGMRQYYS